MSFRLEHRARRHQGDYRLGMGTPPPRLGGRRCGGERSFGLYRHECGSGRCGMGRL